MKSLWVGLTILIMAGLLVIGTTYKEVNTEYLSIHIRANSNSEADQRIKYQIKDKVVEVLTPLVAECQSFEDVKIVMSQNLSLVDSVATTILKQNNFDYVAKSKLAVEEFPTRSYNNFVLESGFYDALIVELGKAEGDNWWCVVYPPLCFVNSAAGSNVVYKSRFLEMIKNFIG